MKVFIVCILATCGFASAALAQSPNNPTNKNERRMSCDDMRDDTRHNGKQAHTCKIVEQEIASIGRLTVDAGNNGGVSIKGWGQKQTLVRSRIEANAENEADANSLASQVYSDNSGGQIKASGPRSNDGKSWWSVSYEIFVPYATDLNLKANNGGIAIVDVRGRLEFKTNNGGVNLARISGDVSGETNNGGIHVDLSGGRYEGNQFVVRTRNGGVHLGVPGNYSGHIRSQTVNGSIRSDFPLPPNEKGSPKMVDLTLGSGGTLLDVSTQNGGISVKKI